MILKMKLKKNEWKLKENQLVCKNYESDENV